MKNLCIADSATQLYVVMIHGIIWISFSLYDVYLRRNVYLM
jgi:hypothetical protein